MATNITVEEFEFLETLLLGTIAESERQLRMPLSAEDHLTSLKAQEVCKSLLAKLEHLDMEE